MVNIWKNVEWVLPLRSDFLTPIMQIFSFLGNDLFLFYAISLGFWIWRKESFRRLMILTFISFLVNLFLKNIVQDPRPDIKYHLVAASGYGFPSGHAQLAMTFWIALAIEMKRPIVWVYCIFIALGMSFSRIYLGVHDLDDVVWGLVIGALILFIFYRSKSTFYNWAKEFSLPLQLLMPWVLAGLLFVLYPVQIETFLVYSCALLAAQSTGLILEARSIRFLNPSTSAKRMGAGLLGFIVITSIVYAYKTFNFGFDVDPLVKVFIYISLLSFWQTFFLPYLFIKLRLSDQKNSQHFTSR